jgi:hypothetical protein
MKLNNPDGYRDQQEGNGASYTIINYIGEMHYNINGGNTNYYLLTENIVPVCCEEEDFKREREMTFTYYLKK